MRKPIFALVDCNNFFVSCERLFRPDLEGKPVVVLSSGDGCAVSRSNEAKALGIPMGAPAFKYRELFEKHNVTRFSGNFELYSDVSRRITSVLQTVTPRIEIYSVDESFLDLSELPISDYDEWGRRVRDLIFQWVGVPVSIGIAPSKTLAKLASTRPKKDSSLGGALSLVNKPAAFMDHVLASTPIEDIWGVGWRGAPKLRAQGVGNAKHLAELTPRRAQQLMGIHGRQMVAELNGTSCYPLELEGKLPKTISATRTFGEDTHNLYVLEAALATFVNTTTFKLRRSGQLAQSASFFLTTNRHKPGYASWSKQIHLDMPTADTGMLIQLLTNELRRTYNPAASYHRAGVWLSDFLPDDQLQTDLLGIVDTTAHDRSKRKMSAVDELNHRYGRGSIRFAAEDLAISWRPKRKLRSPRYTSSWDELPTVHPTNV